MKRLGFRTASLSTEEKARARTKRPQTTEPQLFYIVCYKLGIYLFIASIITSSKFSDGREALDLTILPFLSMTI